MRCAETALDHAFKDRLITAERLARLSAVIGSQLGLLRDGRAAYCRPVSPLRRATRV
jgi:hypothetical protein